MSTLGRKTPSIAGSQHSVYSHGSTVRTVRTSATARRSAAGSRSTRLPWYKKYTLRHAFYTDLQRGAWHCGFYTLVSCF